MTTFRDIPHFQSSTGITLPEKEEWRLTPQILGEINGLPETHGILLATNGILCYIDRGDAVAPRFFLGHLDFFIPFKDIYRDEVEAMKPASRRSPKPAKADSLALLLTAGVEISHEVC